MKTLIITSLLSLSVFSTASAQARDCSGYTNQANFFSSIGLDDTASFWNSVAASCTENNWAEEDRSTVRSNVQGLIETSEWERPSRETIIDAAETSGVELPERSNRGGFGGRKTPWLRSNN